MYVNEMWCLESVIADTHFSADLEYLIIKCRPLYLTHEVTNIVAAGINAKMAMTELCPVISKLQTLMGP